MLSNYQVKFDQTEARDIMPKTKYQPVVIKIGYRNFLLKFRLSQSALQKQKIANLDSIQIKISVGKRHM